MRFLALATILILAACTEIVPDGSFSSDPPSETSVATIGEAASDVRVLDGDTFDLTLAGERTEVRLLGINTPERDECFGSEARDYARAIIDGQDAIQVVGTEFDQFGRLLGYVYAGPDLVNQEMVETGHALALSNDHSFLDSFKAAESQAAAADVGLWNPQACPPAATDELSIVELVGDAPGPDNENPNGEFVVIRNDGATEADLAGWIVRDESSRHRFRFGSYRLAPGAEVTVYSGCGDDSGSDFFWCASDPVWSNAGDTAYLLDPSGNYRSLEAFIR